MKGRLAKVVRNLAAGAVGAVMVCQLAQVAGAAEARDLTVSSGRVDITHGTGAEPIDQVDFVLTFNNTEAAGGHVCEKAADNPVAHGLDVSIQEGYCGTTAPATHITVPYFKPTYPGSPSARYEGKVLQGAVVDALLRTLTAPAGSCGMWNLTLDAVPVNLSRIYHNPVAVTVQLADGSKGCVTVSNALIDQ